MISSSGKKTLGVAISAEAKADYLALRKMERDLNETTIGHAVKKAAEDAIEAAKNALSDEQRLIFNKVRNDV